MKFIKTKKIADENAKVDLLSILFSSCFFTGFIPVASGTFGSLFGLLFFFIKGFQKVEILLPAIILCFFAGITASKVMIRKYGDDPSVIVIDEVVGMWTAVLLFNLLKFNTESISMFYFVILFLAFRVFDIFKIQPAKYFDNMKTTYGIMLDDVVAGVYAGVTAFLISLTGIKLF